MTSNVGPASAFHPEFADAGPVESVVADGVDVDESRALLSLARSQAERRRTGRTARA